MTEASLTNRQLLKKPSKPKPISITLSKMLPPPPPKPSTAGEALFNLRKRNDRYAWGQWSAMGAMGKLNWEALAHKVIEEADAIRAQLKE